MSEIKIPSKCQDCFRLGSALRSVTGERAQAEDYRLAEGVEGSVAERERRRLLASANAGEAAIGELLETCPGMVTAPEGMSFSWLGPDQVTNPDCGTHEYGWMHVNDRMSNAYNQAG